MEGITHSLIKICIFKNRINCSFIVMSAHTSLCSFPVLIRFDIYSLSRGKAEDESGIRKAVKEGLPATSSSHY